MLIVLTFLLTAAIQPSHPDSARLDRNGWVVESSKPEGDLQAGESLWQWSEHCAPQKLTAKDEPRCAPVRALRLNVVDSKARPIHNTVVAWATEAMLADLPDSRLPTVNTAEDGSASVDVPKEGPIWLRVSGPEHATQWTRFAPEKAAVRLQALPAATTAVRLEGEDGRPVSKARVALLPESCTTICPERLLQFDLAGKPLMFIAPVGTVYRMITWSDSHAPLSRTMAIGSPRDAEIALSKGASITMRVVNGARKPIAGADLAVVFGLPSIRQAQERHAIVAAGGQVTIAGLPRAPVQWSANAAGFGRRTGEATLGVSPADLDEIVLSPARAARISVVDASDQPVARVRVIAKNSSAGVTDAKGVVRFQELPLGEVDLQIQAEGFLPAKATVRATQSEAKIILDRGVGIRATLLREVDGRPPESVRARITNNGAESVRTIAINDDCTVSGLRPGSARVRITAEGAEPFDTGTLTLSEGQIADLGTVMLKAGSVLRGSILDETRAAVEGARIRLLRTDGDPPSLAQLMGSWKETTSREDGSFELAGLAAGSQLLAIESKGFAQRVLPNVSIEAKESSLDLGVIELTHGREVHLTCHPSSRCANLEASLLLAGPDFPFLALHAEFGEGGGRLFGVPPGEAVLRLTRSQQIVHEATIEVHPGTEPEAIDVALPSLKVRGTVSVGGDLAQGGSLLFTRTVRGAGVPILRRSQTEQGSDIGREWIGAIGAATVCQVGSEGRFEIDDIEPAGYDVVFRNGGGVTAPVAVTLANVEVQTLPLRFEDGRVEGIVLSADDHPTPARIEITDGAGSVLTTSSGQDGRFQLLGLSQGRATIRATASGHEAEDHVDTHQQAARNVVLRLSPEETEGLTITVLDAAGHPAAGILAFVSTARGMAMASTDNDGRANIRNNGNDNFALPFAVYRPGGEWAFGTVRPGVTGTVSLPARSGRLLIRSPEAAGLAAISAPNHFPMDQVLPLVGVTSQIERGGTLQIPGLSPGIYTVALGALQRSVSIKPDESAVVEMSLSMNHD
jgi:hypothetical protein